MEIVDAQVHPVKPSRGWSGSFSRLQEIEVSAELTVAAMDAVGVDAALLNWQSLDLLTTFLTRFPDRFAGVPFAGPGVRIAGTIDEYFDGLRATSGIVGVRFVISSLDLPHSDLSTQLRNGEYEPYFEAAEHRGFPAFILMCGHLADLHETLRTHPRLQFIVDHFGLCLPPIGTPATTHQFDALSDVLELADFPNVRVKLTGAPSYSVEPYPFGDVWPHLHRMVEAFGVDRLMWGSDFTHGRPLRNYRESVDFLLLSDELSETDKQALFAGTVRKCFGWPAS